VREEGEWRNVPCPPSCWFWYDMLGRVYYGLSKREDELCYCEDMLDALISQWDALARIGSLSHIFPLYRTHHFTRPNPSRFERLAPLMVSRRRPSIPVLARDRSFGCSIRRHENAYEDFRAEYPTGSYASLRGVYPNLGRQEGSSVGHLALPLVALGASPASRDCRRGWSELSERLQHPCL